MARMTFTESAVAAVAPPAAGRLDLWDAELPGFGLRVASTGRRSWQLMYRHGGRKRRLQLGGYPALPLPLAREAALDALEAVAAGRDPAAERAALTGGTLTFERLAEAYLARYAKPRKASWQAEQRMIERDLLPAWRRRPAEGITRRDVIEQVERVAQRGHLHAANRRLALIRKIFAWGLEVDMVPATPVVGVKPALREVPRERLLSEEELTRLWHAWERIGWPFGPLFKLLLVTAQRRGAVAELRLRDIALTGQVWTLPPARSLDGRPHARPRGLPHALPLSAFAVEILAVLPRADSPFVFPARGRSDRSVSGFFKAARRAAALAGVEDFRLQDLRRTAAAGMARLGTPPHVLAAVLDLAAATPSLPRGVPGAVPAGDLLEDKRRALEAWGEHLRELLAPGGAAAGRAGDAPREAPPPQR
ncbi:MAG: integrase arm-type DNA-binding domain-containing protein [Rhodospirillales bacterium]|nr:integrase arm-type DNA-binding domain-containing protein [Rhodospirillales bacterium]